ncbi:MAG TPA: carboxypeptidase-like regulatory domain-containing protein, partial [Thermoanaerobaculia bacterium]|nr:carboxypeptidase-like regulatory domain-containing protein [Thermoanaerobaculia bacterium]
MRKSTRILLVLASALLLAMPLVAQTQTGTISGTVVDTNSSPLPGVTVEVKSPELQGSRIAVTRSDGTFRFAALPPGTYSISYRLEGFSPVDESNVTVNIATETQRRVTMSAGI